MISEKGKKREVRSINGEAGFAEAGGTHDDDHFVFCGDGRSWWWRPCKEQRGLVEEKCRESCITILCIDGGCRAIVHGEDAGDKFLDERERES